VNISIIQETTETRRVVEAGQYRATGVKINKTTINFWFGFVLLILALSTLTSAFFDITTHTWLGCGMMAAASIHLALRWAWIQAIGRQFLKRMPAQVRLKAVVDALLLTVFLLLTMSGIIVSLIYAPNITWFHHCCFYIFISLLLLHLALNWKWIASNVKRRLIK